MSDNKTYTFTEHILFPSTHLNPGKLRKAVANKRILITGASFGIGEQLTYILAQAQANLILVARSKEKLEGVKKQAEQLGGEVEVFTADLTNETELEALINKLKNDDTGIDIFISNAGKSIRRSVFDSLNRFHDSTRTMALNYFAPVKLSLALIPRLIKQQGQIITISAANVLLIPAPKWHAYQASKVAFDQWLRAASPELREKRVAVSHVYLPLVKTRMIEPTEAYKNFPAMSADHAAKIICKCIVNRQRKFKPWWLIFGEIGSVLFRSPIEFFMKNTNTK
ncbi:MAG: SDR family NAD(P)-dependent oxidoreductase [Cytophaga sp.]|uniref:SDR family NAD(P)-dependent oxidoreductase n=1 Tax=Cytophaga sp. TaxID=29535 RepID=UPI003F7DA4D1